MFTWFRHPVIGFVGTVIGVFGTAFGLWAYFQQVPSRAMVAVEPSVRSVLVRRDAPAALQLQVNGQAVAGQDVFAVQLAIWNKGNQSIRPEHVLAPLTIHPASGTRVVDAIVLRQTRTICQGSVKINADQSTATVDWRIFEPDDGMIVQLILVGDSAAPIGLSGAIEAGGSLKYLRHAPTADATNKPEWSSRTSIGDWVMTVVIGGLLGVGAVSVFVNGVPKRWAKRRERFGYVKLPLTVVSGVVLASMTVLLVWATANQLASSERVPIALLANNAEAK